MQYLVRESDLPAGFAPSSSLISDDVSYFAYHCLYTVFTINILNSQFWNPSSRERATLCMTICALFTPRAKDHTSKVLCCSLKRLIFCLPVILPAFPACIEAQQNVSEFRPARPAPPTVRGGRPTEEAATTVFPHSDTLPYLVTGQANIIFQAHAPFHSPYEDVNSLQPRGEYKTSLLGSLFLGAQLIRNPQHSTDFIASLNTAPRTAPVASAIQPSGRTNPISRTG